MSQEKETCGESSRFQIVTGLASERWSGRLEPNLINIFVFCIMWFCIFVLCGIRICLWCGIAGLNLNLMRTYRLWRGTLLENVPHFLIRNLIVGTSLGSRGWSPGKLVKSKGYAKQPPKIKFMIKLCKNLRIVAHWWTLCESHLLRLYYGIFQPSVV